MAATVDVLAAAAPDAPAAKAKPRKSKFFINNARFRTILAPLGLVAHKTYSDDLISLAKEVMGKLAENTAKRIAKDSLTTVDQIVVPGREDDLPTPLFPVTPFRAEWKKAIQERLPTGYGKLRWQEPALKRAESIFQFNLSQRLKELSQESWSRKGAMKILSKVPLTSRKRPPATGSEPKPKRPRKQKVLEEPAKADEKTEITTPAEQEPAPEKKAEVVPPVEAIPQLPSSAPVSRKGILPVRNSLVLGRFH